MAETPDLCNKRLEELEEEITCAVCHGHYQEARLLPCIHYYCRACIEELAKRSQGQPFPCPECRKDTTLPSGGAEQLQSAFFVERMKDLYERMAKAEGKVEAVCESCSRNGKAIAFCRQCTAFLCTHCVEHHKTLRVFVGHQVDTLEDLKKGGVNNISLKDAPPPKCLDHDEPMKIFCFDCNHLICRDCVLYDHHEHKSDFVKKCATESRKSLRDSLTPLQKVQTSITSAEKKLVATEVQVDAQAKEICQTIQQSFGHLKSILEQRETELLNRAVALAQEKKHALAAQRKSLQMAQAEIQSLIEFVERNVENTSNQDLMVIRTQLESKVEEKYHQKLPLEPATTADMAYKCPSLDVIPRDLGSVFHQPSPAIIGDFPRSCDLDQQIWVTVYAPTTQPIDVHAQLKSLVDPGSSVQADVIQQGVGVYKITCTPRIRGRHDLIVKVNDENISNSPFRVFVNISPDQLQIPVRIFTGVNQPWGITLNEKQQLVVAEWGGKKLSIMERDGKRIRTIECDMFLRPRGVVTGEDGAIYVTDSKAQCLFKFNKEGRLIRMVENELEAPYFIKISKNQLYVSDYDSNIVKIFDTNCKVIGTIRPNECPKQFDVAESDGCLYVAGSDKIGVYTCAPNGDFLYHLNIKPSSVKLSDSWGICFDRSGHLFVTQPGHGSDFKGVYSFKSSGEWVASIGGGVMERPAGIVIDQDGFVYVCDFYSSKIVVF